MYQQPIYYSSQHPTIGLKNNFFSDESIAIITTKNLDSTVCKITIKLKIHSVIRTKTECFLNAPEITEVHTVLVNHRKLGQKSSLCM